jgi:hypothetical protein
VIMVTPDNLEEERVKELLNPRVSDYLP